MKHSENKHCIQRSFEEGNIIWEPQQIAEKMTKQLRNQAIIEYLIKWKNLPIANSTWEDYSFIQMYP